jgi:hypothetical protein
MSYGLASSFAFECADRRGRYRPGGTPAAGKAKSYPVATAASERRARASGGGARWRRIEKLSKKLSGYLSDDTRPIWLELEEALNAHWLEVATDQYHRGFSAGRARSVLMLAAAERSKPAVQLRALSVVLAALADDLESD